MINFRGHISRRGLVIGAFAAILAPALPLLADPAPPIFDLKSQKRITVSELAETLSMRRFVLLGEKHDNPVHHAIQAELLRKMVEAGRRPAVVWEMVGRGKQEVLDRLAAEGKLTADSFADAVGWADSGWPDWQYYRPIAEVGIAAGLPMIAGNLDRAQVRALHGGSDALDPALRVELRLDDAVSQAVSDGLLDEVYRGHCELMPRERLRPMVSVQLARDASLAAAMVQGAAIADGAVMIAGGQHVRRDIGAAHHLAERFGERDIAALVLLEAREGEVAAPDAEMAEAFDYAWFTEPGPDKDYCAELRKRFGKE